MILQEELEDCCELVIKWANLVVKDDLLWPLSSGLLRAFPANVTLKLLMVRAPYPRFQRTWWYSTLPTHHSPQYIGNRYPRHINPTKGGQNPASGGLDKDSIMQTIRGLLFKPTPEEQVGNLL